MLDYNPLKMIAEFLRVLPKLGIVYICIYKFLIFLEFSISYCFGISPQQLEQYYRSKFLKLFANSQSELENLTSLNEIITYPLKLETISSYTSDIWERVIGRVFSRDCYDEEISVILERKINLKNCNNHKIIIEHSTKDTRLQMIFQTSDDNFLYLIENKDIDKIFELENQDIPNLITNLEKYAIEGGLSDEKAKISVREVLRFVIQAAKTGPRCRLTNLNNFIRYNKNIPILEEDIEFILEYFWNEQRKLIYQEEDKIVDYFKYRNGKYYINYFCVSIFILILVSAIGFSLLNDPTILSNFFTIAKDKLDI
jgi:hypothetical protein